MDDPRIGEAIVIALAFACAAWDNWRNRKYRDAVWLFTVVGFLGVFSVLMWLSENRGLVTLLFASILGFVMILAGIAWTMRKITGRENTITRIFDGPPRTRSGSGH
jgi:hypothetical protein